MTIDEAIEVLDRYFVLGHNVPLVKVKEASKLGIEALKRLQNIRNVLYADLQSLLPGETEEKGKRR